ncbi:mitogen-activated protein kinase kinase kinase 4-like isoform X4 [Tigriopus californicus]|uniref:mitogen-activated protein kinase kinase kinase 4-like isoform X4 n=1 Tax=Tigriopus californicus TaxID=6832 RepID=UPI0027DA4EDB|nr:mitogen-activated protein kinase kinase kinase 4-like isoform X4 [Tigriopus californicus]
MAAREDPLLKRAPGPASSPEHDPSSFQSRLGGIQIDETLLLEDPTFEDLDRRHIKPVLKKSPSPNHGPDSNRSHLEVIPASPRIPSLELDSEDSEAKESELERELMGEDYDKYDEYGRTPPRSRISNNRKWKDNKKLAAEPESTSSGGRWGKTSVGSSSSQKSSPFRRYSGDSPRRRKSTKFVSFDRDDLDGPLPTTFAQFNQRKRATHLSRDHERSEKWEANVFSPIYGENTTLSLGAPRGGGGTTTYLTSPASTGSLSQLGHSDSVPLGMSRIPAGLKVETRNRFTSLFSSKSVAQHRGVLDASDPSSLGNASSELLTPRRRTSSVSGTDRQTFHKVFSAMIKSNQLYSAEKLDRQAMYRREKSYNDAQVYQNDSGDLIWLELQAWFAGRTVMEQDAFITSARRSIRGVIDEILDFHFETDEEQNERMRLERERDREASVMSDRSDGTVDASTSSDIYYDAYEDPLSSSFKNMMVLERGISEVSNVSELDSDSSLLKMDYCFDDIRYSLDVFNEERVMVMNMALSQVANLLEKVERAEQYYASERTFKTDQNIAGNKEFQARMKCLCMWYNLTDQLRCKIKVLGNVLLGLGATRRVPWPCWLDDPTGASVLDDPLMAKTSVASTSDVTLVPSESSRKNTPNHSRSSSLLDVDAANRLAVANMSRVRFNVSEEDANSTNPSDSNNSTSTTDSAANSQPSSAVPSAIVTETGRQISNSSCGNYFFISDGSTSSQLDLKSNASPYRKYVDKYLKTKGLRKTMYFLNRVIRGPLRRTKMALERQHHVFQTHPSSEHGRKWSGSASVPYHPHLEERFSSHPVPSEERRELSEFGVWNPEFMRMNLPSFRAPYLFLCRIPLDVIHECLKIRLEQKPHEPSELSIRQLMRECKEVLRIAVIERQTYISRVRAAIYDPEVDKEFLDAFEQDMEEFDHNLTLTLEVYLNYLQSFVTMIQSDSSLMISAYQKSLLEEEWQFIKTTCPHIPDGESFSGNTFCQMACGMLKAIGDFLNTEIDEVVRRMFVYPDSESSDDETVTKHQIYEACRGFQAVFHEARERAIKGVAFAKTLRKDFEVSAEYTMNITAPEVIQRLYETGHVRIVAPLSSKHLIFIASRIQDRNDFIDQLLAMHCGAEALHGGAGHGVHVGGGKPEENTGYLVLVKYEYDEEKPLDWAGETLDIRPTAETTITLSQIEVEGVLLVAPNAALLSKRRVEFTRVMKESLTLKHEQRATINRIAVSLEQVKQEALTLREKISEELVMVEEKCDVTGMGELEPADKEALSRRTREILHQCYKFGFEYHKELDRLVTGQSSRTALSKGVISFSRQWMNFVLTRCERGRGIKPRWATHGIDFLLMTSSPNYTKQLNDKSFPEFRNLVEQCYNHIIGDVSVSSPTPSGGNSPALGGNGGATSPITDPGRIGVRSPSNSRPSSGTRMQSPVRTPHRVASESKLHCGLSAVGEHKAIDEAIHSHSDPPSTSSPGTGQLKNPWQLRSVSETNPPNVDKLHMPPPPSPYVPRKTSKPKPNGAGSDEPDTPEVSVKVPPYARSWSLIHSAAHLPWKERVQKSMLNLEKFRDSKRKDAGIIGNVLDKARREDRIHIRSKTVSFSWQRGNKIGQGHFGKVYTAINNETGDIMAMKEIPLQPNDHKTLRNVADELRIFESIHHKHLINHYGVEVHREEMLIFMEYCPEGTLEDLVSTMEDGLEEILLRKYTRQLLDAVACLHMHGVVHRDIKGANIFLADEMRTLKLGDYGCAVKIKAHTTMPGELQGFVGTQAYMAPEVFTKNMNEGYGRAADIWSVGCVVIEMATGKRPWFELESNYQIMFKVGMGESPQIPLKISNEGKEFLALCFEHDPRNRGTAEDLLSEPFLKFYLEEENQSLPMFASVTDLPDYQRKIALSRKSSGHF